MHAVHRQLVAVGQLDHPAKIHYHYSVRNVLDDRKVMRDEQVCQSHLILQILKCLAELHISGKNNVPPTSVFLDHILSYINAHLQEPLTLDQIAEACHISKYHLCHQFKEQVNMTVMQYITEQRITMAKIALLETDKSISVIAAENGYSNFSHFCRAFRQAEGITPAAYRKKYAG